MFNGVTEFAGQNSTAFFQPGHGLFDTAFIQVVTQVLDDLLDILPEKVRANTEPAVK